MRLQFVYIIQKVKIRLFSVNAFVIGISGYDIYQFFKKCLHVSPCTCTRNVTGVFRLSITVNVRLLSIEIN